MGIAVSEWGDVQWLIIIGLTGILASIIGRNFIPIFLFTALLFGFAYWGSVHPVNPGLEESYLVKSRVLVSDRPQLKGGELRFTGQLIDKGVKVRVFLPAKKSLGKGDLLEVSGNLREIKGPSNPGEFNFREYCAHRGIFYNLMVRNASSLRVVAHQTSAGEKVLAGIIERGRTAIRSVMSSEQAVLLEGMLFGFQGEIDEEQYLQFQKSGLVHLFSVSGFHVGFIVLLGVWVSNRLSRRKSVRFLGVIFIIALYGCLTGWPSPMVRASVMACLGLLAYYLGREQDLPTSLALAGILLLLINPANLFEISFQLSFLATWGLVYLYRRWQEMYRIADRWRSAVLLSLAPQLATLPLAAYYFNLVSVISVAANLLLANVAGGAVILGFLGVAAAQFSQSAASLFMIPAGFLTFLIQAGASLLGSIPGSFLWVVQPSPGMVGAAYAGMILLWAQPMVVPQMIAAGQRNAGDEETAPPAEVRPVILRGLGFGLAGLFLASILVPGQFKDPGLLRVVFLDVGQGDSIFIKTPQGFTILVDGGGSQMVDIGGKVVLPYLRRQGIRNLDLAIATHPHVDHLQGLKSVLKECPARMIIASAGCFPDPGEITGELMLLQGLREVYSDRSTRMWVWIPDLNREHEPGNETSVMVRMSVGEISFLLTGDAGLPEIRLLMAEPGLELKSTVLKLAHHGSRHSWSEDFVNRVNPLYGVVSAGKGNPFGHPDPEVIAAMRGKGVKIFRTDQDGAVTFLTRGHGLKILTGP